MYLNACLSLVQAIFTPFLTRSLLYKIRLRVLQDICAYGSYLSSREMLNHKHNTVLLNTGDLGIKRLVTSNTGNKTSLANYGLPYKAKILAGCTRNDQVHHVRIAHRLTLASGADITVRLRARQHIYTLHARFPNAEKSTALIYLAQAILWMIHADAH